MIAVTSTVFKGGEEKYFNGFAHIVKRETYHNSPNIGMVAAYQKLYERHQNEDIIVFVHDDVESTDYGAWPATVSEVFAADPKVAIVGFGGATGLGVEEIYRIPYNLTQLQRIDYYSNQVGWEIHGKQETGVREVAVVDGFLMAVRTEFLRQVDGWKWFPHNFHAYDVGLCLQAIRRGWKVKIVGCEVDHHGGGTSCSAEYLTYCRENGTTPEREHTEPHVWMYNEFRDLLPLRIGA